MIPYDVKRLKHYSNLDDTAQSVLREYAAKLQCSKERPLINKEFDRWKLEREYQDARNRSYRLAEKLVFGGTALASAMFLGSVLPADRHISVTALASIIGTMVGSVCMVAESWYHPLGNVLKPLDKIMMLDYELKDMRGTSVYEEKLKRQYVKKLSQYIKKNYLEKQMCA